MSTIWTPLDRERRQIRLAHLSPSKKLDEQPSCSLHVVSLDDNPRYEALSYTWGDPEVTKPIQLRTLHEAGSIHADTEIYSAQWPATTSLESALRYLRHEYEVRLLWIDAICIDQSNIEERNHQVPLMKAIYSSAEAVRVWLGDPTAGSDDAMTIVKGLGQGVPLQDIKLQDGSVHNHQIQSTVELMSRPWWERTWVQQELILAKRAVFHCGFSCLEWSALPSTSDFNLLLGLSQKSLHFNDDTLDELIDSFDAVTRMENMARTYRQGPETSDEDFVLIFANGRLCHNSDPRDSIYGFLGLMDEQVACKIRPNYSSLVSEVFQDAAIQLTLCTQSLILFSLTSYLERSQRSVPTWVPTWSNLNVLESVEEWGQRVLRLSQHDFFSTCGEYQRKFEITESNAIKLSGTRIDQIARISDSVARYDMTLKEHLEQDQEWRLLCGLDAHGQSRYIAGGTTSNAYWRTLLNDIYVDARGPRRRCQDKDHSAYKEWLHELETSTELYWESEVANSCNTSYREGCLGRAFFVTKKGYFGVGPAELQPEDEVYILGGGKVPYVLRPSSALRPGIYDLVGDCYVHGVIDGEAVSEHFSGWKSPEDRRYWELYGGQEPDTDLPLRDFHDVFIE